MDLYADEPWLEEIESHPTGFGWLGPEPDSWASRAEDKPLNLNLTLADAAATAAALGLPLTNKPAVNAAMYAIVAGLISLAWAGGAEWLFYSRDDHHYCGLQRYAPPFYRRKVVIEAVERLQAAGLIEHQQTKPSPNARYRSRVRATKLFCARLGPLPASTTITLPGEVIILRDTDGRPIPYPETASTSAMRRDVVAHNTFLQGVDVTVSHPEAHYDAQGYLVIDGRRLNTARKTYRRIFKVDFRRVGRWYGPWWQNVPSHIRRGIHINGEPTSEPDIRACHMRLLCALAGAELGDGDPFEGLGLPRNEVKRAVNIMLNAASWPSARGALIGDLMELYGQRVGIQVDLLRATIQKRFPTLEPFWNTGYGVILQRIDAEICTRLQQTLRQQGVPCLSVHDSFIVPQSAGALTKAAMNEEFERACQQLRAKR